MNKLVSICTPCYNHAEYLQDYFNSIIQQDYQNIELILVDDCSTDSSREVIKKNMKRIQDRFVRVLYIENKKNIGVIKNCNMLVKKANGEYIKILASDDIMKKDCISILVDYMNKNPQMDMVYSTIDMRVSNDFEYNKNNKNKIEIRKFPKYNQDKIFQELMKECYISAPYVMMRKKSIERIGPFDINAKYEDLEYWIRMSLYGKIGCINRPVVYYRKSLNSITNIKKCEEKFLRYCEANLYVFNKYKKYLDKDDRYRILIYKYKSLKMLAKQNQIYKWYLKFSIMELKEIIRYARKKYIITVLNKRTDRG